MTTRKSWLTLFAVAAVLALSGGIAGAAQLRFHHVPVDACGNTTLKPNGMGGVGERLCWFGTVREPFNNQPRPTHLVTYRHPCTHRNVTVPLAFPEGTPRIAYVRNRVVYDYGSYTVEAQFLPDGSVDVVYNYGFLRSP
jgi:hypothetical protein